eukprot:4975496-Pleurochrysis_carterae.AAC.2
MDGVQHTSPHFLKRPILQDRRPRPVSRSASMRMLKLVASSSCFVKTRSSLTSPARTQPSIGSTVRDSFDRLILPASCHILAEVGKSTSSRSATGWHASNMSDGSIQASSSTRAHAGKSPRVMEQLHGWLRLAVLVLCVSIVAGQRCAVLAQAAEPQTRDAMRCMHAPHAERLMIGLGGIKVVSRKTPMQELVYEIYPSIMCHQARSLLPLRAREESHGIAQLREGDHTLPPQADI